MSPALILWFDRNVPEVTVDKEGGGSFGPVLENSRWISV